MSVKISDGFLLLARQQGNTRDEFVRFVAVKGSAIVAIETQADGSRIELQNGGAGYDVQEKPAAILEAISNSYKSVTRK